jgi:hypothetical protein
MSIVWTVYERENFMVKYGRVLAKKAMRYIKVTGR